MNFSDAAKIKQRDILQRLKRKRKSQANGKYPNEAIQRDVLEALCELFNRLLPLINQKSKVISTGGTIGTCRQVDIVGISQIYNGIIVLYESSHAGTYVIQNFEFME